jgi:hypothetical protein
MKTLIYTLGLLSLMACSRTAEETVKTETPKDPYVNEVNPNGYFMKMSLNGEDRTFMPAPPFGQGLFSKALYKSDLTNGNRYELSLDDIVAYGGFKIGVFNAGSTIYIKDKLELKTYQINPLGGTSADLVYCAWLMYEDKILGQSYIRAEKASTYSVSLTEIGSNYVKGSFDISFEGLGLDPITKVKNYPVKAKASGTFKIPLK